MRWRRTEIFEFLKIVEAGSSLTVPLSGNVDGVLYIVGAANVLRRAVHSGDLITLEATDTSNAGHYLALLVSGSSTKKTEFDIVAARQPASLNFLAKPSRLPVDQRDGISGVVYVFDSFGNLILDPAQVSFHLNAPDGAKARTATTQNGVAWTKMDSSAKPGSLDFEAEVGGVHATRVVQQVPGDPCTLRVNARQAGSRLKLETEPVRDCHGNPLPDGTVVTFTETKNGTPAATVDAPLKHDVARTEMPAYAGGVVSVALGVVMGNEVRVGGQGDDTGPRCKTILKTCARLRGCFLQRQLPPRNHPLYKCSQAIQ